MSEGKKQHNKKLFEARTLVTNTSGTRNKKKIFKTFPLATYDDTACDDEAHDHHQWFHLVYEREAIDCISCQNERKIRRSK